MADTIRLATFNLENLDDGPGLMPPLAERIAVLRPQLVRTRADILFLQEVNGQPAKAPRTLAALDALLEETPFAGFARAATESPHGGPMDKQNLVILSRWPIGERRQLWHDRVMPPRYRPVTAAPAAGDAEAQKWDRPLLYARIDLPSGQKLHAVNLHLRAPLAAMIAGQKSGPFSWRSTSGWAEGFYLAALKRSGQALEARLLADALFDDDPQAMIAVCGDFNAETAETPTRILMAGDEDTGNSALTERNLLGVEMTVAPERRYSVIHAGRPLLLDHMLVSRPLSRWLRSAEIHNEGLVDELVDYANKGHSPESHHAPVVVEFEMPTGGRPAT
jgi:endonuclease/exonuclease/phosphatase family metal-dependent hydrolase